MSASSFGDEKAASGLVEDGRVEQVRSCSWRRCSSTVSLDPWSMKFGVLPGRWTSSDAFNSSMTAGVFCGSSQRLEAMKLRLTWGWRRRASSGGRRRRQNREVCIGSRGLNVIFLFLRGLCVKRLGQPPFVSHVCICMCTHHVRLPKKKGTHRRPRLCKNVIHSCCNLQHAVAEWTCP